MTVHAAVRLSDGTFVAAPGSLLAVFSGEKVRGVAEILDGPAQPMQFVLAVGADAAREKGLTLRVFDARTGTVSVLGETVDFAVDSTLGRLDAPMMFHAVSEPGQDQVASAGEFPPDADALRLAYELGAAIPAKPHLHDRSTCQYNALKACLDRGLIDQAVARVREIANWRQGVLYTDIALATFRNGGADGQLFRHYLEAARRARRDITGMNAGWQKARVTAHMALALAKVGFLAEAESIAEGVEDPVLAGLIVEKWGHVEDRADYDATLAELDELGNAVHFEIKQAVIRTYARILGGPDYSVTTEQAQDIVARIEPLVAKLPVALRTPAWCEVSRALFGAGMHGLGMSVLNSAQHAIEERGIDPRVDVAGLVEIAQVLVLTAGRPEQAEPLLRQAASVLPAAKLTRRERVDALLALVRGYAAWGEQARAIELLGDALKHAQSQVNGRPRFMMFVDLCLTAAECGLSLPEQIEAALDRDLQHRDGPW
jgi:tetratricopeptide (TPR) repeat protein